MAGHVLEVILIALKIDGVEDAFLVSMLPVDAVALKRDVDSGVEASGIDVEIVLAVVELMSDAKLPEDCLLDNKDVVVDNEESPSEAISLVVESEFESVVGEAVAGRIVDVAKSILES